MWLIVGLGNPGPAYAGNRHNIGFMAVEHLLRRYAPMMTWRKKFHGECAEFSCQQDKIIVLKPQTFMNLSGDAVIAASQFYKIPPAKILVIHDELDIPFGRLKTKRGGGAGGHNGLRSIDSHLGQDYHRLRLGIGHPGDKNRVSDYVLNDFSKAEQALLPDWLGAITEHLPLFLAGKDSLFQTHLARLASPASKREKKPDVVPPAKPDPDQPASP